MIARGEGFTVMLKFDMLPVQPLAAGVTEIVAVTGALVVLTAVKAAILSAPEEANPIAVLELVHVKLAPGVWLVNDIAGTVDPLHTVTFEGTTAAGVGLTVMVKVVSFPMQLFAEGVKVMVAVTGAVPVFIAVKDAIVPVPEAPRPMDVFELLQEITVLNGTPNKLISGTTSLLHTLMARGTTTVGSAWMVMLAVAFTAGQPDVAEILLVTV